MELETEHAYAILVTVWGFIVTFKQGVNVAGARKKYGVPLPNMYATGALAETENGKMFNCYQRVHQNTLETFPSFLFFMGLVGSQHPLYATICGISYVLWRILYARGYYSGDPSKRLQAAPLILGLFALVGGAAYIAIKILLKF